MLECPPLLPDYQAYMRGIDRGDQLMSYYNVGRRSKKWWKRVFAYLLEVSIVNAYVLQKFKTGETDKFLTSFIDTACRYLQVITQWSTTKFGAQAAAQIGQLPAVICQNVLHQSGIVLSVRRCEISWVSVGRNTDMRAI